MSVAATDPRGPAIVVWRQLIAILRLELRKTLFGRRSLLMYLLALLPVGLFVLLALVPIQRLNESYTLAEAREIYSGIYQTFMLRAVVFFGCVGIFTSLFRGEVLDRSLHYYLLAPVRRGVLVTGKYLSGLLTTWLLFVGATLVSYLLIYSHFSVELVIDDLSGGVGLRHLLTYLGVTWLACLGYGAVFLILGLLFRNPILPALTVLAWEFVNPVLPRLLQKISVIHYLKGLCPIPISAGPFAVVVEPPPAWVSVAGLGALASVVLVLSCFLVQRTEIRYGDD